MLHSGTVGATLAALASVPPGVALNVNIPSLPRDQVRGIRRAGLAAAGAVQLSIGEAAAGHVQVITMTENGPQPAAGTDSAALAAGCVAVTPLRGVCEAASALLPWPAA